MYVDDVGALVVYVKDTLAAPAARAATAAALDRRGRGGRRIELRVGTYDFDELGSWRLALRDVLGTPGVVGSGISERRNRILIRVATEAAKATIEQALDQHRIPRAAVLVELAPRAEFMATLNNRVRPLKGGLLTLTQHTTGGLPATSFCTLGAVLLNQRNNTQYLLTNSHCTQRSGAVGLGGNYNAAMYQGDSAQGTISNNRVGSEFYDPPFVNTLPGCPTNTTCRNSDAALFSISSSTVTRDLGAVARPTDGPNFLPTISGSTTIACDTCVVRYQAQQTYPIEGDTLQKIGRVTGWTAGRTDLACFDLTIGQNTILCSIGVSAGVQSGDSGSPVFQLLGSGSTAFYAFAGILFAGDVGGGGFYASAQSYIYQELQNQPQGSPGYGDLIAYR